MNRRQVLEWLSRALATVTTAIIGVPAFKYFLGGMHVAASSASDFQRLKRLQDLPVGRPVLVPVLGSKQDGWTRSDQQVIGRVWLIREQEQSEPKAFTTVCPHMGCQVMAENGQAGFICPCHQASFAANGSRKTTGHTSPSPRDLDGLECRITTDAATNDAWVEVKYEKFVTGLAQKVVRG